MHTLTNKMNGAKAIFLFDKIHTYLLKSNKPYSLVCHIFEMWNNNRAHYDYIYTYHTNERKTKIEIKDNER